MRETGNDTIRTPPTLNTHTHPPVIKPYSYVACREDRRRGGGGCRPNERMQPTIFC